MFMSDLMWIYWLQTWQIVFGSLSKYASFIYTNTKGKCNQIHLAQKKHKLIVSVFRRINMRLPYELEDIIACWLFFTSQNDVLTLVRGKVPALVKFSVQNSVPVIEDSLHLCNFTQSIFIFMHWIVNPSAMQQLSLKALHKLIELLNVLFLR